MNNNNSILERRKNSGTQLPSLELPLPPSEFMTDKNKIENRINQQGFILTPNTKLITEALLESNSMVDLLSNSNTIDPTQSFIQPVHNSHLIHPSSSYYIKQEDNTILNSYDPILNSNQFLFDNSRQRQSSISSSCSSDKIYSFVTLPGTTQKKRPRRRYDEVERLYHCHWPGCTKSYGTLNHLNAHISMQQHGSKRHPSEFKEMRKEWRRQKKARENLIKSNNTTINNNNNNTIHYSLNQLYQPHYLYQQQNTTYNNIPLW